MNQHDNIIDEVLEEEIGEVTGELRSREKADPEDLAFPGAETVLAFIAMKLVIPVVASFFSRVLYDRYKEIRTSRQARNAIKELSARGLKDAAVPSEDFIERAKKELTVVLGEEGLSAEIAEALVIRTFKRVNARLAG